MAAVIYPICKSVTFEEYFLSAIKLLNQHTIKRWVTASSASAWSAMLREQRSKKCDLNCTPLSVVTVEQTP